MLKSLLLLLTIGTFSVASVSAEDSQTGEDIQIEKQEAGEDREGLHEEVISSDSGEQEHAEKQHEEQHAEADLESSAEN